MNPTIETLMNRRSVRRYEDHPIPRDILNLVVAAGNAAPTGANAQGWGFVVVEDRTFGQKLMALAIPRYKAWMERASQELIDMRKEIDGVVSNPIYYDP